MTTILLCCGLAAAILATVQSHFGYTKAAANWSYFSMVILWLFFILKG
jgi:hypothetical protein